MPYVIIGGPNPGYAETWSEAKRRSHKKRGSYSKKVADIHEARAYYESVTGTPLPDDALATYCRVRIETKNGIIDVRSVTQQQIAALRSVGLWL